MNKPDRAELEAYRKKGKTPGQIEALKIAEEQIVNKWISPDAQKLCADCAKNIDELQKMSRDCDDMLKDIKNMQKQAKKLRRIQNGLSKRTL